MRQDIIIGVAISGLIHFGLMYEGKLFPNRPPPLTPAIVKAPTNVIEIRKLEDDPPEKVDIPADAPPAIDLPPPPTQVDLPQLATDQDITQHIQPPLPDDLRHTLGMRTIPDYRPAGDYGQVKIFNREDLDQQPVARVKVAPIYPANMKQANMTGEVVVDFIVDSNGAVLNAHAFKSSNPEFESAAVQAVSKWRFKAGWKNGRAVSTHMQVPIVFHLDGD